ncbi:hypothetical protein [Paracoccus marinaquae]|uniref:PepSY domain-containing protein n=1 Tax=Paracoccus marinaquae TaxID=2841926 RepID=A0ABS6ANP2_9RHOB|nr:hypothetical protein [Paracoccus marinaquae]MBU3032223.1 hypothetical protein [Paracoccus marinaquae]
MSRQAFTIAAGSVALAAVLGTATLAQDAAPAAPATDLPEILGALNLENIEIDAGKRGGRKIEGDLPGGGEIEAFVDPQGKVMMIEADDVVMPQSVIDAMVPQAVRDSGILSQFAVIDRIGGRDGRLMIGGEDASGEDLRAGFDEDGRLMRFGRGDDDHDRRDGRRDRDDRMHGKRDHGRGGPDMGPMGGPRGAAGQPGDMPPPPPFDAAALTEALTGAGYSGIGDPRPTGPRLLLEATNPAGEAVLLEVDPAGEVLRETAR